MRTVAQGMDAIERIDMLQDIAANVVAADVVERHDFGSARIARMVCTQCLATSARKLSVTRLHNQLRSRGFSIGWDSLVALVGYLEEASILYRVPEYTTSVAENSRKASKVYANDQSLMLAISSAATSDRGLALETHSTRDGGWDEGALLTCEGQPSKSLHMLIVRLNASLQENGPQVLHELRHVLEYCLLGNVPVNPLVVMDEMVAHTSYVEQRDIWSEVAAHLRQLPRLFANQLEGLDNRPLVHLAPAETFARNPARGDKRRQLAGILEKEGQALVLSRSRHSATASRSTASRKGPGSSWLMSYTSGSLPVASYMAPDRPQRAR